MIHPTADVSQEAKIGPNTRIWHHAHIRERAVIGKNCIIGKGVYIDHEVIVGDQCKIQNGAFLYHGTKLEDGVFIGPQVCLTNDKVPRAITPDGNIKTEENWNVGKILVRYGASIGCGAIILPGVTIGRFAMVAAGAVVTCDVPEHTLVIGMPARKSAYVCRCGRRLENIEEGFFCPICDWYYLPERSP